MACRARLRASWPGPAAMNPKVFTPQNRDRCRRHFDRIVEAWKVHPWLSAINHMTFMSLSASGLSAGLERLPKRSLGLPELSLRFAVPKTDACASERPARLASRQSACPKAPPRFDRDFTRCVADLRRCHSRAIPTLDHARPDRSPASTPWIQGFQPEVGATFATWVIHPPSRTAPLLGFCLFRD